MARAQPDAATHRLHHFPGHDTLMLTAPHSRHRHDRQPGRISMAASLQGMPRPLSPHGPRLPPNVRQRRCSARRRGTPGLAGAGWRVSLAGIPRDVPTGRSGAAGDIPSGEGGRLVGTRGQQTDRSDTAPEVSGHRVILRGTHSANPADRRNVVTTSHLLGREPEHVLIGAELKRRWKAWLRFDLRRCSQPNNRGGTTARRTTPSDRSTTMRQIQIKIRQIPLRTSTRKNTQPLNLRTPSGRPLPL